MAPLLYKLIVAYDGTRYNGLQRQQSTEAMDSAATISACLSSSSPSALSSNPLQPQNTKDTREDDRICSHTVAVSNNKRRRIDPMTGSKKGDVLTIQECLEGALSHWSGYNVADLNMQFAGRTDKGVHARGQVISVRLPTTIPYYYSSAFNKNGEQQQQEQLQPWEIQKAVNSRLPVDISIQHVQCLSSSKEENSVCFHPRHDAKRKQYTYTIKFRRKVYCCCDDDKDRDLSTNTTTSTILPICEWGGIQTIRHAMDPSCLWVCPWALDCSEMDSVCQKLQSSSSSNYDGQQRNYRAFVHKRDRDKRDHIMTVDIFRFETISEQDLGYSSCSSGASIVTGRFVVEAKGFRRCMVRNLVGFAVDLLRHAEHVQNLDWEEMWKGTDNAAALVHAAPASGLCLERVDY